MKQMLSGLAPERIDDVIAAIALYRPGPMDSIPRFIECRHDPSKASYAIEQLEPILRSTYGCVVYQEQVMSIFREIAGYTFGHADVVRRAMSKKKADVLLAERESFIKGARARGIDEQAAAQLFSDMESFANYAFNKSHAAAYAMISYRTAYLKCHYPHAYFSALLTSVLGNQTKVAEYIAECASRGIRVLPPDINESRMYFSVSGRDIRFGLLALKNVGRSFLQAILSERERGRFSSFEDFIHRMPAGELNKRMVESLLKAGTFDGLGVYRSRLLRVYETMIDQAAQKGRNNLEGQLDMFSMLTGETESLTPRCEYPDIPEFGIREKLLMEKEATGMYFSGQMLDEYANHVQHLNPDSIADYVSDDSDPVDKTRVCLVGIVTSVTQKSTRNGDRMAFFTIEDRMAEIECVAFAKQYADGAHLIHTDSALCVTGTISVREDEPPKLLVNHLEPLIENQRFEKPKASEATANPTATEKKTAPIAIGQETTVRKPNTSADQAIHTRLFLRVPDATGSVFCKALNLVELFDGDFPAYFFFADEKRYDVTPHGVSLSDYVLCQLCELLGEENVILK